MTLRRWLAKLRGVVETIVERGILDERGRVIRKDLLILVRRCGLVRGDFHGLYVGGGRRCSDDGVQECGGCSVLTVYGDVLLVDVGGEWLGHVLCLALVRVLWIWLSIGRGSDLLVFLLVASIVCGVVALSFLLVLGLYERVIGFADGELKSALYVGGQAGHAMDI